MSTALAKPDAIIARLDQANQALTAARDEVDAKKVVDIARAVEVYAKRQKLSEEAIASATALKIDAMTLMGEFLEQADKADGGDAQRTRFQKGTESPPTLRESGISKKESMHAQSLAKVKKSNPDLHEKVRAGKASVTSAHVEVKRHEKRAELKEKAKEATKAKPDAPQPWEVIEGEVGTDESPLLKFPQRFRLVFADPPYNIGFKYAGGYNDRLPDDVYLAWCERWMRECADALTPDGSMWVLINDEYAAEFRIALELVGLALRKWVIWYESFGVNNSNNFNNTHRHLFYCVRDPKRFIFNQDAVSRPSDRQTKYNDARANPEGKILDDVWFDIPRLVGTAAERIPDFPTQLPLALLRRIVGCSSEPGDSILDPFSGSATTGVAAIEADRRYVGIERSKEYADASRLRLQGVHYDARR